MGGTAAAGLRLEALARRSQARGANTAALAATTAPSSLAPAAQPATAASALGAPPSVYVLQPIYFRREMFGSPAECLTAAYRQGLPLDLCR